MVSPRELSKRIVLSTAPRKAYVLSTHLSSLSLTHPDLILHSRAESRSRNSTSCQRWQQDAEALHTTQDPRPQTSEPHNGKPKLVSHIAIDLSFSLHTLSQGLMIATALTPLSIFLRRRPLDSVAHGPPRRYHLSRARYLHR
jgi:hypothetical protein